MYIDRENIIYDFDMSDLVFSRVSDPVNIRPDPVFHAIVCNRGNNINLINSQTNHSLYY